ncbi:MAG TPA: hypothetical protein VE868_02975 [Balneolaceae bacterium]|nr:hypothetical protein [Balneolaceae bacterium]
MKTKELNFMNVKEADLLSRDEMRNVMAGSGGYCNVTVECPAGAPVGYVSCYGTNKCKKYFDYVKCDGVPDYCFS